jgi:hypothetical protein
MSLEALETQFNTPVHNQAEFVSKIRSQKTIINQLVDGIQEANEMLLNAASSSSEPDKVLAASKVLVQNLAEVAKA